MKLSERIKIYEDRGGNKTTFGKLSDNVFGAGRIVEWESELEHEDLLPLEISDPVWKQNGFKSKEEAMACAIKNVLNKGGSCTWNNKLFDPNWRRKDWQELND